VSNTIRGAFEYQGQKCSAASRIYVAESIWPEFKESLVKETEGLKIGGPEDYVNYVNAVIYEDALERLNNVIESAKSDGTLTLLVCGKASKEEGFFVYPTVYQTSDPRHEFMERELFGPICVIYVYRDAEWSETLKLVDNFEIRTDRKRVFSGSDCHTGSRDGTSSFSGKFLYQYKEHWIRSCTTAVWRQSWKSN
jgi:1-pyrroline-5-carboxylate dehydrogenase